jgi:hypothetical protein
VDPVDPDPQHWNWGKKQNLDICPSHFYLIFHLGLIWPNYRPPGNFIPEMSRLVGLRVDEELLLRCGQALQDLSLVGVKVLVVQQVRQHKPERGKINKTEYLKVVSRQCCRSRFGWTRNIFGLLNLELYLDFWIRITLTS